MRKLLMVILSVLLIAAFAPVALAEPKPAQEYIPQPVDPDPSYTFEDWWIELNPDEGGSGYELPGDDYQSGALGYLRGGGWGPDPTTGRVLYHGLPIGFNFNYMQGPAEGHQQYEWDDVNGNYEVDPGEVQPVGPFIVRLEDNGYDEVWVGTKGYVAFHEPVADIGEISSIKWSQMPHELPLRAPPNNFIAPYLTDLVIGDNDFREVTQVQFICTILDPDLVCLGGYWDPCAFRTVHVPRGRLLYKTVGEEPNRKFVVEYANAKLYYSGDYCTFQAQLWEGNNAILFLFKDFKTRAFYEDPPHETAFNIWDSLTVGMEDFYGTTGVGQTYLGMPDLSPDGWAFFNPLDEMSAMAFVPDAYAAVRAFVP